MGKNSLKTRFLGSNFMKSLTTSRHKNFNIFLLILFTIIAAIILYFAFSTKGFLSIGNVTNLGQRMPADIIVAVAQTFVIIAAGIDLSVGAILAFSGSLTTVAYCYWGLSVWSAIILGLTSGLIFGAINGLIITKAKVPDFISTLGTMVTIRGIALILTNGLPVPSHLTATTLRASLPPAILWLGSGTVFGVIPAPLIISIIIVIIGWVILKYTALGRSIYAVGGNKEAAAISGINVNNCKVNTYVISGLLSALAGIILIGRMNSANALMADQANLDSIASVVIGGTGLEGGQGGVFGSFIGAGIMNILKNILNLRNVQDYIQRVFMGLLIIIVVAIDQARRHK